MTLEPQQQKINWIFEGKMIGKYKTWQLQRIETLLTKLKRPFHLANYISKSRTQLKTIIHKLNKEALLI